MTVFDLSLSLDENTPIFEECDKPNIEQIATIKEKGWNENRLSFSSHFGTHIDAPYHFFDEGKKLTDFPIETFIGEGIVLDATGQDSIELDLDEVKPGDIVFFYTGQSKKIETGDYYKNSPVISKNTADRLVSKQAKIIGLDAWSPDDEPFEIHKILLGNDIMIVENLVNLEPLVGKRFQCYVLPLKIQDGDGAPCRAIAIL